MFAFPTLCVRRSKGITDSVRARAEQSEGRVAHDCHWPEVKISRNYTSEHFSRIEIKRSWFGPWTPKSQSQESRCLVEYTYMTPRGQCRVPGCHTESMLRAQRQRSE